LYGTLARGQGISTTSSPEGGYAELNEYLHVLVMQSDESFDILLWWKENEKKYQILHRIVKDILACPSTIPIELAFSARRPIFDDKQASLTQAQSTF